MDPKLELLRELDRIVLFKHWLADIHSEYSIDHLDLRLQDGTNRCIRFCLKRGEEQVAVMRSVDAALDWIGHDIMTRAFDAYLRHEVKWPEPD